MSHLRNLREFELQRVISFLPKGGRILEVGAGAGWQAARLMELGFQVEAVDVPESEYEEERIFPVVLFDGVRLPFADKSFDCVFSSNVLEHVPNLRHFQREMQRVLRPYGVAVHVVPSGTWSLWTMLAYPIRYWTLSRRHGEHALCAAQEILLFSRWHWRRAFAEAGWKLMFAGGIDLFYTGVSLFDRNLSLSIRRQLARILGSACHVFVLRLDGDTV